MARPLDPFRQTPRVAVALNPQDAGHHHGILRRSSMGQFVARPGTQFKTEPLPLIIFQSVCID